MFIPQVTPIQPINVIVHNDPGMSEWIKTVLSAVTGAVFALGTTFLTDYLKKRELRKEIAEQISIELMDNLTIAERGFDSLKKVEDSSDQEKKDAARRASQLARTINADRFSYYFAGQKALVYEVDQNKQASGFYATLKNALPFPGKERDYQHVMVAYSIAVAIGMAYVRDHNLTYIRRTESLADLFKLTID